MRLSQVRTDSMMSMVLPLLVNSSLDDSCAVSGVELYSVDERVDGRIVQDLVATITKGPMSAYPHNEA